VSKSSFEEFEEGIENLRRFIENLVPLKLFLLPFNKHWGMIVPGEQFN